MDDTRSTLDYYQADISTKKHPDELRAWWFKGLVLYDAFKVKFESRTTNLEKKQDILTFRFARDEQLGPFRVDLKDDYKFAWSGLPSTVQFATKEAPYGFLLLSPAWVASQSKTVGVNLRSFVEGGGKWPIGGGDKNQLKSILEQIEDKQLRDRLSDLLSPLFG
ncbi:hypothetical protein [Corallococcus sp. 4LFB]|uniref:hypothetical protein n=1 Tax=Corallococcus sp. 4LFB TaxID=3383249 RepID=UPI0039765ADD